MLSTHELLAALWRRRAIFLATAALIMVGVVAVTLMLAKVYRTTTFLIVRSSGASASDYEATQTNQVLLKTYAELMQSRNVADDVARRIGRGTTGTDVQSAVSIAPVSQSQLIEVTAESETPERAKELADTYAEVSAERLDRVAEASGRGPEITLAEPAPLVSSAAEPRPRLYIAVGFVFSLVIAALVALLRHRFDQRLDIGSASKEFDGSPVLAHIPRMSHRESLTIAADAFRLLVANVTFANLGSRPGSVAVASPGEGEGKSTVALGLARAASELGLRVLLVDGDLRHPRLTQLVDEQADVTELGFSSLLLAPDDLPAPSAIGESAGWLTFVHAGPLPPNPAALLGSANLAEFERRGRELFDLVVFDSPPILVGPDGSLIASACEGVVVVLDASRSRRPETEQALAQLRRAAANVLGVVVNRVAEARYAYSYASDRAAPESTFRSAQAGKHQSRSRG